jgi:hypothetical protein
MTVCVFLYIANSTFVFFLCIVRFRKLIDLFISFLMMNFRFVCCLLDSVKI